MAKAAITPGIHDEALREVFLAAARAFKEAKRFRYCKATTKSGNRCRGFAMRGTDFCAMHADQGRCWLNMQFGRGSASISDGVSSTIPSICMAALEQPLVGGTMMTIMVPDLLEATADMHQLWAFVVGDLHEVRSRILAAERVPQQ